MLHTSTSYSQIWVLQITTANNKRFQDIPPIMNVFVVLCLIISLISMVLADYDGLMSVNSLYKWNDSPQHYSAGQIISIAVVPADQVWHDWYIDSTADGYDSIYAPMSRYPKAKMFELVCCVGQQIDDSCDIVGVYNGSFKIQKDGVISCFANDVDFMYSNNSGSISVQITAPAE